MAPLVRAAIGRLSPVGRARFLEHQAKIESATGVATLIRARVCRLGLRMLGAPFEQYAEVARGAGVTRVVGAPIDGFRAGEVALLLQK